MAFILGKKIGMTRAFKEGRAIPVTVLEAGKCVVIQIKTKEKDGYNAVQVGFGKTEPRKLTKPERERLEALGYFRYLCEFRVDKPEEYKKGQVIDVSIFSEGDKVKVSGVSKGKGFAGVVKRFGFKGSPATHGTKHTLRAGGSIGAGFPEHVFKGMKMPGRMGGKRITTRGLEVIGIDKEKNMLVVKGTVPGHRNGLVEVRSEK